jgi:hypothetical protein
MFQTNMIAFLVAISVVAAPMITDIDASSHGQTFAEIVDADIADFSEQVSTGAITNANFARGNGEELAFTSGDGKILLYAAGAGALVGLLIDGTGGAGKGALLGLAGGLGYLVAIKF